MHMMTFSKTHKEFSKNKNITIILGSKSPGRKSVLEHAGYEFEVMVSNINEKAIRSDDYKQLPLLLARAKATVLVPKIKKPAILITSDQVVIYKGELREKPADENQAREYLKSYGGDSAAITHTAVVVIN